MYENRPDVRLLRCLSYRLRKNVDWMLVRTLTRDEQEFSHLCSLQKFI